MLPILALAALAAVASAAPAPAAAPAGLPSIHVPEAVFSEIAESNFAATDKVSFAKSIVASRVGADAANFEVTSNAFLDHNGVTSIHLVETFNGVPIVNSVANVNLDAAGSAFSVGHPTSSSSQLVAPASFRSLTAADAVVAFAKAFGYSTAGLKNRLSFKNNKVVGAPFALQDINASMKFYRAADGTLRSVWDLEIRHSEAFWHNVFVDASSAEILGANNWVHDGGNPPPTTTAVPPTSTVAPPTTTVAPPTTTSVPPSTPSLTFKVVPFNKNSILDGQVNVGNPVDTSASPNGWTGAAVNGEFTTTGNNVKAAKSGRLATSRNGGVFDYVYDTTADPATAGNVLAATQQVFYITNKYHDILYKYGFDEASGNFQSNNFGKGGSGNDAVTANIQAPGSNNANFATPPDGQAGTMNMFIFDLTTPKRDGDMENAVVQHELTHGLSNRLTGGRTNANCLSGAESGGMGEGWSDVLAWWASMDATMTRNTDRATGVYVVNKPIGIRRYPYSTSLTTNPLKYSSYSGNTEVHAVGEIWSNFLYETYWNYVDLAGFEPNLDNVSSQAGNIRFLQDVVDGMKLQPCNPTMLAARDAILQATARNTNGKFTCAIWKAFAKRGLGSGATTQKRDVFAVPAECQ
ncbi:hypothetical protein HDU97_002092 [Phlyctochytrium planicorne]|nr:hypothetical protein HDU97_002092 [Phlyctochytrium planicorne]